MKRQFAWISLAAVLMLSLAAHPAAAQLIPGKITCKYDPDVASYFPDWKKSEVPKDALMHVCTYSYDGHHKAELVLPPVKSPPGVCIIRSTEAYLTPGKDGHLVQGAPPDRWKNFHTHQDVFHPLTDMQAAAGPCPPPSDKGYVRVYEVPPGTFLELVKLWRSIVASPDKFEQNFALVPTAQKRGYLFEGLKAALTSPTMLAKIHLETVAPDPEGWGRRTGDTRNPFRGVPEYLLGFSVPGYPTIFYHLAVDWVDGGFKVIGVAIAQA